MWSVPVRFFTKKGVLIEGYLAQYKPEEKTFSVVLSGTCEIVKVSFYDLQDPRVLDLVREQVRRQGGMVLEGFREGSSGS